MIAQVLASDLPPDPPLPWYEVFHPFGVHHAIVFIICAALMTLAAWLGARNRGTRLERDCRLLWCGGIIAWQASSIVYYATREPFSLDAALPLQICDLAAWVAALALLSPWRWPRTMLYFWGIGLSTQAFFTPILRVGPSHADYWFFWINHLQIVGSAVYDIAVRGYRPRWRDWAAGFGLTLVYAAAVTPLNLSFKLNLGFIGDSTPTNPTLADALGPWPLRVLWITLIAAAGYAVMVAVWRIRRRKN